MLRYWIIAAALSAVSTASIAGVTIHFDGSAPSDDAVTRILRTACDRAAALKWDCRPASPEALRDDPVTLSMLRELGAGDDLASVRGVVINPHPMSSPTQSPHATRKPSRWNSPTVCSPGNPRSRSGATIAASRYRRSQSGAASLVRCCQWSNTPRPSHRLTCWRSWPQYSAATWTIFTLSLHPGVRLRAGWFVLARELLRIASV